MRGLPLFHQMMRFQVGKAGMPEAKTRALILVPLIVCAVVAIFFVLGFLVTIVLRVPEKLNFPFSVRFIGFGMLMSGFLLFGWLLKYRRPVDIAVSTYATFSKTISRTNLEERSVRTEPLVVKGPYAYVRHPLYTGVILLILGWWLLLDYSFLFVSAVLFFLWLNFVVAPFEEKELRAIFGEDYEQYSRVVPRIIPFPRRRKS